MVRIRTIASVVARVALLAAVGCGGSTNTEQYALEARLGVYDDGSGRAGLSALVTLRDESGAGPDAPWNVSVRDGSGATLATLEYTAAGAGSYFATWLTAVSPNAGSYDVIAARGGDLSRATASIAGSGLALPVPALAADASQIEWAPVAGAKAYLCRVHSEGALVLETSVATTSCDVSALPPGAYAASILALSADLGPIAGSAASRPDLGGGFHVSEARLGFVRPDASAPAVLIRAAGGAYDDGIDARSLAFWVSITDPGGVPTSATWDVEVIGPNLPANAPLSLTYWARFPRLMAWAPSIPATPGVYTVTAWSGAIAAQAQFTVGAPAWLGQPLGVTATDGAQGSARAEWQAVTGARAYLASAYDHLTGARTASGWVGGTSIDFPAGSFVAGRSYDVFVAATDADMTGGAVPTQVSVAENVFDFASFTAR